MNKRPEIGFFEGLEHVDYTFLCIPEKGGWRVLLVIAVGIGAFWWLLRRNQFDRR